MPAITGTGDSRLEVHLNGQLAECNNPRGFTSTTGGNVSDDDAEQVDGEGGAGRVQTGMLFSSGSSLGGPMCGNNCSRLLINAVLNGTPKRRGLAQRLRILADYEVMTDAEIEALVKTIEDERYDF